MIRTFLNQLVFHFQRQKKLRAWRKTLCLDQHELAYQQIFSSTNGFMISRQARGDNLATEFTYGEITFLSFIALLSLVHPDEQTVFYDLGSGIGTAVLACAMVYPVKKCVGVEYFAALHQAAVQHKANLSQWPDYQQKSLAIDFIHSDFLLHPLNDASLIFINASTYIGEAWEKISSHLAQLPQLFTVISTSKPLIHPCFCVIKKTIVRMSWGDVYAFIHQKINIE